MRRGLVDEGKATLRMKMDHKWVGCLPADGGGRGGRRIWDRRLGLGFRVYIDRDRDRRVPLLLEVWVSLAHGTDNVCVGVYRCRMSVPPNPIRLGFLPSCSPAGEGGREERGRGREEGGREGKGEGRATEWNCVAGLELAVSFAALRPWRSCSLEISPRQERELQHVRPDRLSHQVRGAPPCR